MNTRPAGNLCSGEASPSLLGTQIVLNQDTGLNFEVPLSAMAAKSQGYAAGACIEGMGQVCDALFAGVWCVTFLSLCDERRSTGSWTSPCATAACHGSPAT